MHPSIMSVQMLPNPMTRPNERASLFEDPFDAAVAVADTIEAVEEDVIDREVVFMATD
jgi:hypothetical protein